MNKFYTFVLAACTCITAVATSSRPVRITEYLPGAMAPVIASPDRVAALADADYTEWESLGTATTDDIHENMEASFNQYCREGDEKIVIANTSEVMVRKLRSDESVWQIKFCKLFGYSDMIADYNAASCYGTITQTPTGMPVPSMLAEYYGCRSIDFMCSVSYSEARRIVTLSNAFFVLFDNQGFKFNDYAYLLPDARPDIDFGFYVKAGGMKSTDRSITLGIDTNGVDHLRYITRFDQGFSTDDLNAIIAGACDYKEATDDLNIDYTNGYGYYRVLALAYDDTDKYMGIYKISGVFSNLSPEGTWAPVGRGVWHHPDNPSYPLIMDNETGEIEMVYFPEDKLYWEVDIEKRTDTDREIYRVVNPYSPSCGLADTFNSLLDRMFNGNDAPSRPETFSIDDTFWFVFDVTEPGNFSYEYDRPNGLGDHNYFMSNRFYKPTDGTIQHATFKDGRVCFPNYSYTDLIIDLPGYDSVDNAIIDIDTDTPVEYYDLQGRRVAKPSAGIYIRRQGTKAEKIRISN